MKDVSYATLRALAVGVLAGVLLAIPPIVSVRAVDSEEVQLALLLVYAFVIVGVGVVFLFAKRLLDLHRGLFELHIELTDIVRSMVGVERTGSLREHERRVSDDLSRGLSWVEDNATIVVAVTAIVTAVATIVLLAVTVLLVVLTVR